MVAQNEGGIVVDFYANYVRLCSAKGVSPSADAIAVGLDKSAASRWARGSAPRYQTLICAMHIKKLITHIGMIECQKPSILFILVWENCGRKREP